MRSGIGPDSEDAPFEELLRHVLLLTRATVEEGGEPAVQGTANGMAALSGAVGRGSLADNLLERVLSDFGMESRNKLLALVIAGRLGVDIGRQATTGYFSRPAQDRVDVRAV